MRKLFFIFLMFCLVTGTVYGAERGVRKSKKNTNIVDICDPQKDPSCAQKTVSKSAEKGCGVGGRPLRVAGMIGNAPFGWVEADKGTGQNMQSFGLGRFVLEKIVGEMGIRYISTGYTSHEDAVRALKKGEVDMLLAVYNRGDLGKEAEIVPPAYFTNYYTVFFKKGNELPIESYQDLVGLRGVVRKEEMIYPMIYQRLPKEIDLKEVLSAPKVFEMLMNDEVDYILASPYALEGELRRYKMQDDIVSDGVVLDSATLFFAFSKNSTCYSLKDEFSKVMREHDFSTKTLTADIQRIIDDWGERFRSDEVLIKTKNNTHLDETDEKNEQDD